MPAASLGGHLCSAMLQGPVMLIDISLPWIWSTLDLWMDRDSEPRPHTSVFTPIPLFSIFLPLLLL